MNVVRWLEGYVEHLSMEDRAKVIGQKNSDRTFIFGGRGQLELRGVYIVPAMINGEEITNLMS